MFTKTSEVSHVSCSRFLFSCADEDTSTASTQIYLKFCESFQSRGGTSLLIVEATK